MPLTVIILLSEISLSQLLKQYVYFSEYFFFSIKTTTCKKHRPANGFESDWSSPYMTST